MVAAALRHRLAGCRDGTAGKRLRPVGWRYVNGPRWRDRGADWSTAGVVARLLVVFVLGLVLGALLQLAAVAPSACSPAPSPVPITGNVGGRGV